MVFLVYVVFMFNPVVHRKLQLAFLFFLKLAYIVYLRMKILDSAEKFKSDLMKIAMTTLSSKILSQDKEHFAKLAVDAVLRLKVIH